jgi:tRNA pseudouridine38-40 synthase
MLGPEIRVASMQQAAPDFHARFSAVSKRYAYTLSLCREPDPFSARYAWRIPWKIDVRRLADLARRLVGTRDFAGFQCAGASVETTLRTLHSVELFNGGVVDPCDARDLWQLEFCGDGFLYKMVRNIVGTTVDIARGVLPEGRLAERLASKGPFRGHTAPAHGLTLIEVGYGSNGTALR